MLTGEMLHKAYVVATPDAWHSDAELSQAALVRYAVMADYLNANTDDAAERDALRSQISQLHAQINEMTETILRIEQERDAFQQLAVAHEVQAAPTATMLLEQERAAFHTQMRDMGIPFQEGDHA